MIENMYANIFLFEINPKFTSLIENIKDISLTKQWRFYKTFIHNNKTKTIVIISDALRYGCGVELKDELKHCPANVINCSIIYCIRNGSITSE